MAPGIPLQHVILLAWIVGSCKAYDATKDCTFEFYNRSVYGATRNPGCEVEHIRWKEYITFDLVNFGAETIKLGVYQNYSNLGRGTSVNDLDNPYESINIFAECSESPVLEFGTESCTFRLTGAEPEEFTDSAQLHHAGDTCQPDVHYIECSAHYSDCRTPPCHEGISWGFRVDRVKGCPFFYNERNDTIARMSPENWFAIWNADKLNKTDPNYHWLTEHDFFMWDFDADGDNEMPDFFVRKVNNPQCTYFQFHLASKRGWRPLPS